MLSAENQLVTDIAPKISNVMQLIIIKIEKFLRYIATRFPVSTQPLSGLVKRKLRQLGLRFKKFLSYEKFIYYSVYKIYNNTLLLTL